jgi:putative endonuclease
MTGAQGEEIAAEYLVKRGYRILQRNYRTALGEIDIVAREGNVLVFVEVKARSGSRFGPPQSAVDLRKQTKMIRVALAYLRHKRIDPCDCRFDVVAVVKGSSGIQVELFQNAFEVLEMGAGC